MYFVCDFRAMATYMSNSHPRYTVRSLLKEADRTPTVRNSPTAGLHCDHVIELQLIVAALNDLLPIVFWQQPLRELLIRFDIEDNIDVITIEANRNKGAAVRRLVERQSTAEDAPYVTAIVEKWQQLREKLKDYEGFRVKMDKILESI